MWDLPGSGMEPMSPALADRLFSTEPPGKPFSKAKEIRAQRRNLFPWSFSWQVAEWENQPRGISPISLNYPTPTSLNLLPPQEKGIALGPSKVRRSLGMQSHFDFGVRGRLMNGSFPLVPLTHGFQEGHLWLITAPQSWEEGSRAYHPLWPPEATPPPPPLLQSAQFSRLVTSDFATLWTAACRVSLSPSPEAATIAAPLILAPSRWSLCAKHHPKYF